MSGMFVVDTAAVDEAATELSSVSGKLSAVDVAGPFGPIAEALPGSRTSVASLWVSSRLGAAVQVFAKHADSMSTSAAQTAEAYRVADHAVANRLTTVFNR